MRLALPDGRLLSGGAATLETLARLPSTRPLMLAARALHADGAIERLYDVVAGKRDRLGPDGPAPRCFP